MDFLETPITNDTFQLYGEDLRCLDSGKPMMTVLHYDAEINDTIEMCKKNITTEILGSTHPLLRRWSIRRIGENSFKYDKNMVLDDMFETTDETDIHIIFNSFDRRKNMYRIYASTKSKVICIVWSHAIFDGITAQYGCYTMLGKNILDSRYPPQSLSHYSRLLQDCMKGMSVPPSDIKVFCFHYCY